MLHFLVKHYRQPYSWMTVDTISLSAMRVNLGGYGTTTSQPCGYLKITVTLQPSDYSLWPQYETRLFSSTCSKDLSIVLLSEALHFCGLNQMISILSQILQKLEWQWAGRRQTLNWSALMLLTVSSQLYRQPHEASLLTSDMLHFNCFVFPSSSSTLYNINTADMACKLLWPYLFKVDSWFYTCLTPSRLTCSESLQPPWLQSTGTF